MGHQLEHLAKTGCEGTDGSPSPTLCTPAPAATMRTQTDCGALLADGPHIFHA